MAIYLLVFFILVLSNFFSQTARNARNIKKVAVGMSYNEAHVIMGDGVRATSGGRPYNDSIQAKLSTMRLHGCIQDIIKFGIIRTRN